MMRAKENAGAIDLQPMSKCEIHSVECSDSLDLCSQLNQQK